MVWMVRPDAARDTALAVAAAIPVVAVAYYTVRGSESSDVGERAEFDLPSWARSAPPGEKPGHPRLRRALRGLISLLGRVPTDDAKIIVTEAILFAADAAFVRSFTPGLFAALIAVLTDGNLRWIAVSVVLLYGMASQLVVHVTVSALLRRDAKMRVNGFTTRTSGMEAGSGSADPSIEPPSSTTAAATATHDLENSENREDREKRVRRAGRLIGDFWLRRIAVGARAHDMRDMRPFNVLALVVGLQTVVGAAVLATCAALFVCGQIAPTHPG
jgi:hypothetical protein